MAKINRFIVQYAEVLKNVTIDLDGKKPPKYLIKRFVKVIKETVNDPRYEKMCTYPLETILVTAFIGILCNASNWAEISDVALDNRKWLSKFVEIPNNRVPIDDTYRRVFSLIDPDELLEATKKYLLSIFTKIKNAMNKYMQKNNVDSSSLISKNGYTLINIDGKVANGTGRYYNPEASKEKIKNLQTLNVYDASDGISMFSLAIEDKTNEIPVAQDVILNKMNLKNCIVTMDAIHAQHKTFDVITKKHGDFLIGLKLNQKEAFEEIDKYITPEMLKKLEAKDGCYKKPDDDIEKYYYFIKFNDIPILGGQTDDGIDKWIGCRNILVYRHQHPKSKEMIDQYFVTSLNDFETAIESCVYRWDVENLLHRYLDVSFNEDLNKTMDANAFNNFSIMNKLCLSLLKLCKPLLKNKSMTRMRQCFARKPVSYLFSVLAILDIDVIEQAFNNCKK